VVGKFRVHSDVTILLRVPLKRQEPWRVDSRIRRRGMCRSLILLCSGHPITTTLPRQEAALDQVLLAAGYDDFQEKSSPPVPPQRVIAHVHTLLVRSHRDRSRIAEEVPGAPRCEYELRARVRPVPASRFCAPPRTTTPRGVVQEWGDTLARPSVVRAPRVALARGREGAIARARSRSPRAADGRPNHRTTPRFVLLGGGDRPRSCRGCVGGVPGIKSARIEPHAIRQRRDVVHFSLVATTITTPLHSSDDASSSSACRWQEIHR
jgi:hypothetical protein